MIQASILADSIAPSDTRLTTMKVTMPRFVLAEFNTHRVFSRNAGSSRAISVERRLKAVMDNPVIPVEWGIEQKGMQATGLVDERTEHIVRDVWLEARNFAVEAAQVLNAVGIHKQIVNRLIEPFSYVDVIVSSTLWDNFFTLRCSPMAQPEMRVVAEHMREAFEKSVPTFVPWGQWHCPTINKQDMLESECLDDALLTACGRIARVSYHAHPKTLEEDRNLARMLMTNGHWSPFEHVAKAELGARPHCRNFVRDWAQYRALVGG